MSTEQFRHCVMAIVNKLNSIINRWDRRYGLFWTEKDLIDNSVINLRFNATDVIDKIVRDPSIECLLRSSFAPTYYPDMIHNADDLVKYQILDSFKEQLEREAHEDVLFGYDSRSKAMTFYFRNFIERNQFLKLVNQYNEKFNTDLRAGVLREKLLSSGSIFQPMSYTLEFIPTKGFGYEGYKAETLGNHFLMAELIDRNPMALTEDLLTKFV
jgi:hypothetical protein